MSISSTKWAWVAAGLLSVGASSLPRSTLAVRHGDGWRVWWSAQTAPVQWRVADTARLGRLDWRAGIAGVEWTELVLAGSGEAWRTRVIVARLDLQRVRVRLDTAFDADHDPAWKIERVSSSSALAVNAGQFLHTMPWGRVVLNGTQWLAPGVGPLSSTVVIDSTGSARITHSASASAANAKWAFQSYPTLLRSGEVPVELRGDARAIDLGHRDARAAIGVDAAGRMIIALTRFDALGATLGFVPFGLTTPEMAGVMGALGARDAVMLDGGISGQLLIRDANGTTHSWRGARPVPLALIAESR